MRARRLPDTVRQREPRDVAALRAAAEAREELNERDEALTLLDGALMLTQGHAQQQVALLAPVCPHPVRTGRECAWGRRPGALGQPATGG